MWRVLNMRPEDPGGWGALVPFWGPGSVCHSDSGKLYLLFHKYKISITRTVSMVTRRRNWRADRGSFQM